MEHDWPTDKVAFVNPPFCDSRFFIRKIIEQARRGVSVILLAPDYRSKLTTMVKSASAIILDCPLLTFRGYKKALQTPLFVALITPESVGVAHTVDKDHTFVVPLLFTERIADRDIPDRFKGVEFKPLTVGLVVPSDV
jgi:hypothetical protein